MSDIVIPENMPGLDEAMAKLDEMEAAEKAANPPADPPAVGDTEAAASAILEPDRAAQPDADAANTDDPNKPKSDTPAAADGEQPSKESQSQETDPDAGKAQSRFAKARERQERSWSELNKQKEEFKAQIAALEADRQKFTQEREAFNKEREQAESPYSPEDYEKAAEQFENQGKYDFAEAAREKAKQLRANPPKPRAEADQAKAAERAKLEKEWLSKAAIDYPEVAKNGSEQNAKLKALLAAEPGVLSDPKGMYYASRLVAAESAAARVPDLEKELGELRAKVKVLETASLPSVPGSAAIVQPGKTAADDYAELERMAREVGVLSR